MTLEEPGRRAGQVPDGAYPDIGKLPARGRSHVYHVVRGQSPHHLPVVLGSYHGSGIGLPHVGAELGKHLVEADPDGGGDAELVLYLPADLVGDLLAGTEQPRALGHVEPVFVYAEGFYQVRVVLVYFSGHHGKFEVAHVVRPYDDEIGTLGPGFPYGLARLYAELLRNLVFCQHDAVPGGLGAAHGHRARAYFRVVEAFDARVEIIQIAVQNHPGHDEYRRTFQMHGILRTEVRRHSSAGGILLWLRSVTRD